MSFEASPAPAPHEHVARLVEVAYDDAGHAVREIACATCPAVWFE